MLACVHSCGVALTVPREPQFAAIDPLMRRALTILRDVRDNEGRSDG